jgi:hypothetical protein
MGIEILDIEPQIYVSSDEPKPELIDSIEHRRMHDKKPEGGLWTSTKYQDDNIVTSAWVDWAEGNLRRYENNDLNVWELTVDNPCKVLQINTKNDVIEHSEKYTDAYQNERHKFDWSYIYEELDCDAIWLTETGMVNLVGVLVSDEYSMRSWDVESMLWSDWKFSSVEKVGSI